MRSIHKFNLTAVLLSATVISTPSPASTLPQTLSEHRDLSAPISLAETDGSTASVAPQLEHRDLLGTIYLPLTDASGGSPLKRRPFASVCFITDAGNCAGLENDEGWNLDNEDRCKEEGYDCTPCPGGSEAVDICPYSGNCHKSCKNTCDSAYNKSCNGADETGKGDSCNGLYKECCNLCSDYPYTDGNLPTGYVKNDSCNSCSGTKYKASCDTSYKYQCVDDGYDGNANKNGGSGASCDGKYKACNCKSGYNWNATTGTCDISCDPAYKFDCIKSSITHISGGDGSACDSKYQRCTCTSPYTWSTAANACTCPSTYKYTCSGTGYSGGSGNACDGLYTKCICTSPYTWTSGTCKCPTKYKYTCSGTGYSGGYGTACGGKYTKCTCKSGYEWNSTSGTCELSCDTSYKYTCTGANQTGGSGTACDGKYKSCQCDYGYTWNSVYGTCKSNCDPSYKYPCIPSSSNHITGGVGMSCSGQYTKCTCQSGYTWNASSGTCTANSSGPCDGKSNGANGNYYCCNNDVVGVKTSSMNFYVAMNDAGSMSYRNASYSCQNYSFCSGVKGSFPSKEDFTIVYQNKSTLSNLLTSNGGTSFQSYGDYWVSPDTYYINMGNGKVTQAAMGEGNTHKNVRPILSTSSSGGDSPCSGKSNGANGNYYCCNNDVVGVKTSSMNFYVAMKDIGEMNWTSANQACKNHVFCDNIKGKLPNKEQLLTIYNNLSAINSILYNVNGNKIGTEFYYWTSEYYGNPGYYYYYYINMLFGDEYESYLGHDNCYSIPILSTSSSGGGSTCDSSYKYTCTYSSSTHISGGSGSSCGGKYKACVCDSSLGYSWDSYTGTCKKSLSSSSSSSSGGSLTPNIFVCGPSGPCTANTSRCHGGAFSSYALAEQECASRCSNGTTGQLTYLGISNRLFGEVIAVCDYKCICT